MGDDLEETGNLAGSSSSILKTIPIIRDLSLNPSCSHGPTILFERNGTRFFTCSAYRSRKLCQFYMTEDKWIREKNNEGGGGSQGSKSKRCFDGESRGNRKGQEPSSKKMRRGDKKWEVIDPLSAPNQTDKGEAQYHFNDATVEFFMEQLKNLEIDSVLCIGTPSLHQNIVNLASGRGASQKIKSFLLDIDQRFSKLYEDEFSLYNMCNHHFFQDFSNYADFLLKSRKLAVVADPPFGVKVELIWHGCLQGVQRDLTRLRKATTSNNISTKELDFDVFWIFPYFMEGHILKCSSELKMSDFHVEYRNHAKYSGSNSKSKSSPIRIFTTVPLPTLTLPKEDYRYCDICEKWVDKQNMHCGSCETCTTKDGGRTYIHCNKCKKCVKPTWKHCGRCKTCHLVDTPCKNTSHHPIASKDHYVVKSKHIKLSHPLKPNHDGPKGKHKFFD